MKAQVFVVFLTCLCATGFQHQLRSVPSVEGVQNGEIPTAGEAVGQQVGVDVPNPHQYTGAIVGGGMAGTLITIAIFCVASYFCYKWNADMTEKGQEPYCGIMSVLCCCCCTPHVLCFPVDAGKDGK